MEGENKVSIWVEKLENKEIFNEYIHDSYDDDGNMSSIFMRDFNIEYYDAQFKEALFDTSGNIKKIFNSFSYSENFFNNLSLQDFSSFNCFILIYNFSYNSDVCKANCLSTSVALDTDKWYSTLLLPCLQ